MKNSFEFDKKQRKMDNQNQADDNRQMHQGNWSCSQCGAAITELPFEPDGERPLFCRDCYRNKRA